MYSPGTPFIALFTRRKRFTAPFVAHLISGQPGLLVERQVCRERGSEPLTPGKERYEGRTGEYMPTSFIEWSLAERVGGR